MTTFMLSCEFVQRVATFPVPDRPQIYLFTLVIIKLSYPLLILLVSTRVGNSSLAASHPLIVGLVEVLAVDLRAAVRLCQDEFRPLRVLNNTVDGHDD